MKVGVIFVVMKFLFIICLLLPLLTFGAVWQYEGALVTSNTWQSASVGETMTTVHGASNGWENVTLGRTGRLRTVSFLQGASPFGFSDSVTNYATEIWVVTRCSELAELSTLLSAPVDVRVVPELALAIKQLGNQLAYRLNGEETNVLAPSEAFQLVEIRFAQPTALSELYLGNAIVSPLWKREWCGEVGEVLLCTAELTTPQRSALLKYLAIKWSLPVAYDTRGVDVVAELSAMGIKWGSIFSTVLLLR